MHMDIFFIFLKKHALYRTMRAEVIIIIIIVIIITILYSCCTRDAVNMCSLFSRQSSPRLFNVLHLLSEISGFVH